ncbi:MAG: serine--tRNA ligase [Candidatus Andersenbacteria bacterium RIFCSPHIGHO2_12_FULL_45_11b]|uniref:Serine--tRNA ligase n=1 Tax=Candidatus Andersenbacteria bacterium RIFCSPHIGHO2_12_FULL_45_11b TaxID=1797282 RepID=A0A1G1X9B5_9BACT|nr:MAG: serine--tRNA ligase [Candidatus Andersenbacteria bacterium RIFCSPHIGHO2_12_FULL_45_11b]
MIDIALLRNEETKEATIEALGKRGVALVMVQELLELDKKWITASEELENLKAKKKEASKIIPSASAEVKMQILEEMKVVDAEEKTLAEHEKKLAQDREIAWKKLPNIPLPDVQAGGEQDSFLVIESDTAIPDSSATPKNYMELMGNRIDMERGAKVAGARFTYLSGDMARLQLGITSYVMDMLAQEGFTQVAPPVLLNQQAMAGMGYLDQAGDEVYQTQDALYLVGTSEQSLGAMHMNEILDSKTFPLRYAAFTPCFRREAGSHGKDVKGILRLHQFDKVEMFSITTPEKSEEEHQFLLARQRAIMDAFALPYRVVRLAADDLGGPSAKTYDIETWIPSQQTYRETHSTSNTTDYQSRRLNIRYKTETGDMQKVHMLNGTAIALSRLLIALIENHQKADGSVRLPVCLHPYLPFQNLAPVR